MPTTVTITTAVTVPPDIFDIHYWYFGLAVTLCITALVDGMLVSRFNIAIGDDIFIIGTLFGAFVGSIISLLFNVIPWEVPISIFFVMFLYFWRGR